MQFLVDAPKRDANLIKHGFDLAEAFEFDWASARYTEARHGREKAIGPAKR